MSFPGLIFYNSWYKIRQVVRSTNENYFILVSSIILFYIIYQVSSPVQTQGRIKRAIRHRLFLSPVAQPEGVRNMSLNQRTIVVRISERLHKV